MKMEIFLLTLQLSMKSEKDVRTEEFRNHIKVQEEQI